MENMEHNISLLTFFTNKKISFFLEPGVKIQYSFFITIEIWDNSKRGNRTATEKKTTVNYNR